MSKTDSHRKTQETLHTLESNISTLNLEKQDLETKLLEQEEFLRKANRSNMFTRFFYGLNAKKIETTIEQINSRLNLINLRRKVFKKKSKHPTKKIIKISLKLLNFRMN